MSRLEKHIADYARAIEDKDGTRRAEEHLAMCEHLGVSHSEFQPFEGHNAIEPHWDVTKARAAVSIRNAIKELKKRPKVVGR